MPHLLHFFRAQADFQAGDAFGVNANLNVGNPLADNQFIMPIIGKLQTETVKADDHGQVLYSEILKSCLGVELDAPHFLFNSIQVVAV